jgi:putative nucleotidyltransferase with HDIG domain
MPDRALGRFSSLIAKMLWGTFATSTATTGVQAIEYLRTNRPDLLVVEESIPGGGLRFCELMAMSPNFSDLPIILMSVTPSPDGILRARAAGVNTYLAKPFRPSELQKRIDNIFAPVETSQDPAEANPASAAVVQDPDAGKTIRDRLKQIEGLPPFPATHAQILELANSDKSSSEEIAEQLQMDPSLLASIFKMVNSSAYGFQKKVDSLKLAVTLLGLEEIANLVMTAQIFKNLGDYEGGSGFDRDGFWKHSVGTAFITRTIAKKLQTEVESAFLAGMLHDLGKVVLDRCFADYYRAVLDQCEKEHLWIGEAEQQLLGLTHADVGGQLATEWKFAEKYLYSILHHHEPEATGRYQRLTSLVHIADHMCRSFGYGSGGDDQVPELDPAVLDRFSLGERGYGILVGLAEKELEGASSFLAALSSG